MIDGSGEQYGAVLTMDSCIRGRRFSRIWIDLYHELNKNQVNQVNLNDRHAAAVI
jgi:hypothetical protein